jgi:hypothetical protein
MSRRKKVASVAFTGAAALAAVGFTGGHAHAAGVTKVTVTPGGKYTAVNTGAAPKLVDKTTPNTLTCTSAKAAGSLPGDLTGSKVGTVTTATFSKCKVLTFSFKAHLNKAATLFATSPTTAAGITKGELKGISATISGEGLFGACRATVTGSLSGSYSNKSGVLTIDKASNPTLTITKATGCGGVIRSNDKAFFQATYLVSASNPTSPIEKVTATG